MVQVCYEKGPAKARTAKQIIAAKRLARKAKEAKRLADKENISYRSAMQRVHQMGRNIV